MKKQKNDIMIDGAFPSPPVKASELLVPITSWIDMFHETKSTGVEFDQFWHDSIEDGVAYFFRWLGDPRSTVLAIWDGEKPMHIECRMNGDLLVSDAESERIIAEVTQIFRNAGFWHKKVNH